MGASRMRPASDKQLERPPRRPPNGGWGWVVVLGVAVSYMTNMALFSVFGLLFGGQLEAWGLETTGIAVISSTMNTIQNFSGLLVGPMVKRLGGKAVSLLGGALISSGMMLSYFATDPWQIFITWGFLVGLGLGLLVPSTFLNINSYFTTRRSQAVGIALAGTGLGQILMPHLVRLLLEQYGFHSAVLIMGAIALHSLPGCLLYRKPVLVRDPGDPEEPNETQPLNPATPAASALPVKAETKAESKVEHLLDPTKASPEEERRCERRGVLGAMHKLADSLGLDLLVNLRFMNLAVGTGLIYTTQTSFSMIFPFFLMESVGLSAAATATCMSAQSVGDLASRLLLPSLMSGALCDSACRRGRKGGQGGHHSGLAARTVMLVGALGSAGSRSVMATMTGFTELLALSAVVGLFRGATVLNQNLVVAEHVPASKLPAAIGMAMVVKGACVLGLGSALGVVRDKTGSFPVFIHALTLLAMFTGLTWMLESLFCAPKRPANAASRAPR
ncbi:monocarboxylate transporter 12 [Thrips palmi]|uniref:Monocarboxylate transporter 12 n=1 Tax=Thrips palmi TaxID=161013 RepID=A0A6P8Z529_THRPL|nr:monocarboxylate transporter 12 [Thrips palmi]